MNSRISPLGSPFFWAALAACFVIWSLSGVYAQDKPVTLTVNSADLKVIGDALGALPYKEVAPLVSRLQAQVIEQQKPKDQSQVNKGDKANGN